MGGARRGLAFAIAGLLSALSPSAFAEDNPLPAARPSQPAEIEVEPPAKKKPPPPPKTFIFPGFISQTDFNYYAGPGVQDYQRLGGFGLDYGFRMTRLGIRVGGRVESKFMFHAMAIVGRSLADGAQRPANNPTVEDAWVGYEFDRLFRVRTGQFQVPYTLDANEFYPPNADFLEPTLTTRFISAPEIRPLGVMAWGGTPHLLYSAGYINTAGKVTLAGPGDLVGRVAIRPLGSGKNFFQIGGGGRVGGRDPTNIFYDQPSLQNSTFQYNFWSPVYVTDLANEFHVIPSNQQRTIALEALGAIDRFELAGEIFFAHQERREAQRAFLERTLRSGTLSGISYYVTAGVWVYGPPKRPASARGIPYMPPEDPPASPLEGVGHAPTSVQLAARWEQIMMEYDSIARSPGVARGALDAETRDIKLNAFQVIANVYVAKHVRLSAEYTTYFVPGKPQELFTNCSAISCPGTLGNGTNQAIAPGAVQQGNITAGTLERNFSTPAPNAQIMNQLIARVQLTF